MKNKTLATWLSIGTGTLGLHRIYLFGWRDPWGWAMAFLSLLGLYGYERAQSMGLDDPLIWFLLPVLGLTITASALNALYWGLMPQTRWNGLYNPSADPEHRAGRTNWFTVIALVLSMMIGTTALLSSLAYGFQRYFESQISEAEKLSQ
jgi:hypothetical protein